MKYNYSKEDILNSTLVKTVSLNLFKKKPTEIIKRPASFIIRLKDEPIDKVTRIILLPPMGYTSNKSNETNPHPEARRAKILIKGALRPNKSRFNPIKKCIKYQYYATRDVWINQNEPYPPILGKDYLEEIKSSKQKFFVVSENGKGFYHSLVNLSNEWVMMILEKELQPQIEVDVTQITKNLEEDTKNLVKSFYKNLLLYGDKIFSQRRDIIEDVLKLKVEETINPLINLLNVLETGKHEPCTVYAVILKIGKKNKKVLYYLEETIAKNIAPRYYLEELIKKISKM